MKKLTLAFLPLLVLFLGASSSRAGITTIDYEITGGAIDQNEPDPTPVTGGTYSVEYQALGLNTLQDGPAVLKSFVFSASGLSLDGTFSHEVQQQLGSPIQGNGTAGAAFSNVLAAALTGSDLVHCTGGNCGGYGFTSSVAQLFGLRFDAAASGGIAINGPSALLNGSIYVSGLGATSATVTISAREVNRSFVPEPGSFPLVGFGALILAALRRSRFSHQPPDPTA